MLDKVTAVVFNWTAVCLCLEFDATLEVLGHAVIHISSGLKANMHMNDIHATEWLLPQVGGITDCVALPSQAVLFGLDVWCDVFLLRRMPTSSSSVCW